MAILLTQAVRLAGRAMQPVTASLDVDKLIGPIGEQALAIVGVLVIALAAGLVARTAMDNGWVAVFLPQAPTPLSEM